MPTALATKVNLQREAAPRTQRRRSELAGYRSRCKRPEGRGPGAVWRWPRLATSSSRWRRRLDAGRPTSEIGNVQFPDSEIDPALYPYSLHVDAFPVRGSVSVGHPPAGKRSSDVPVNIPPNKAREDGLAVIERLLASRISWATVLTSPPGLG